MYMAEPFEPWQGLQRGSPAYNQLKQQRADVLWQLVEQVGGRLMPGNRNHRSV